MRFYHSQICKVKCENLHRAHLNTLFFTYSDLKNSKLLPFLVTLFVSV